MIAYLDGRVAALKENQLILDVNHMGWQILITGRDADRLAGNKGEVRIHTYLQVREDAMTLFGFLERDDLEIFRLLINVNGIGPKAALGILTVFSANDLRFAVLAGDAKTISRAPGIGSKTAQKLILELKDKLKLEDVLGNDLGGADESEAWESGAAAADARGEAVQALVALGYSSTDALRAVRSVEADEDTDTETILKLALKALF